MPKLITTPYGLTTSVRGLCIEDSNKMEDPSTLYDLRHVIRDACKVVDYGVYQADNFQWGKVFYMDRFEIMLAASILSYKDGNLYRFKFPCTNPAGPCRASDGGNRRHQIPCRVDLTKLRRRPVPEATLERLRGGENVFEAKSIIGEDWAEPERLVKFCMLDEDNEVEIVKKLESGMNRKKRMRIQTRARILEIEGYKKQDLDALIDKVTVGMIDDLRKKMEAQDGGIDTAIMVTCDRCGWGEEIDLPLAGLFKPRSLPWPSELADLEEGAPVDTSAKSMLMALDLWATEGKDLYLPRLLPA